MDIEALWEELVFEIGALGKHLKDKRRFIGTGNHFTADMVLVSDETELYLDEGFAVREGSSGEFLKKILEFIDLSKDDFFLTTLTKSSYRLKEYEGGEQELLIEYLKMQISIIKPKIIVALGAEAAELILGRKVNFLKERGTLIPLAGDIKLLITYSPGYAMKSRNEDGKKSQVALEFLNDLKLAQSCI